MKFEGTKLNGQENTVFQFFVGQEELEIISKLLLRSLEFTPKTTQNQIYHARLKSLANQFSKVYISEVKGKTLPTRNHWDIHDLVKHTERPAFTPRVTELTPER